ncbi:U32 family peptidase [Blastopirellula marina]|uniref:Peptidase U32 n=1 Tax=Blastopirellula marina TaxID=124 RepID=A0A2S8FN33_9BACT|nr:U32 family peptidase [Blastopirellula marina]PQO33602.1 peptidase U32 [Blastopirellula marina]PTL43389.1 U32 family peptidase [Blastopirellula marina]
MGDSSAAIATRPELLAPAGDWDCARAAIANGADAIYFGLETGFNARARAKNFSLDDLPQLMEMLHWHGVRGYTTVNTLTFSDELATIEPIIRRIAEAGTDAVLVQDLGLVDLIRRTAPDLPIHASTQMTMTSAECIAEIENLGIERVVLARELSVNEIGKIHEHTTMPLEAFVHGALCVAYSGQCLTSESLGGRSANRGQCAQACRLPYELICDGADIDLGDQKYLLSPQDLAAYALVPELLAAGVVSLKIEGRLKTPEYVANITRHYRQAIDSALAGKPVTFTPRQVEEMELSFSRGFSPGWLHGCDHKMLVPATSSAKRGVLVAEVVAIDDRRKRVKLELFGRLKAGDGIVFQGDRAAGNEQGGRVFTVSQKGRRVTGEVASGVVEVDFPRGSVDFQFLKPGLQVWKSDDPALTRELRKSFSGELHGRDLPLTIEASARVGQPLRIVVTSETLGTFSLQTEQPLEEARKHALTEASLKEQLARLGGSGYMLSQLSAKIAGNPMVPLSLLGKLRKEMVTQLDEARHAMARRGREVTGELVLGSLRAEVEPARVEPTEPQLIVLARSLHQLEAVLETGIKTVYADFQDIREYKQAVPLAREANAQIWLVTPRIQKPGEMGIFKAMAKHAPDGIVTRNLSGLKFFTQLGLPCVADFSFNAANELTVDSLRQRGAIRVTPSYDLNRDQLLVMAQNCAAHLLEPVVHQHMPMFHMEHCVFCSVLSPGTNKTNCGRPCDEHEVKLRDRVGAEHPLKADVGCRNTLFNKTPQSGAEIVQPLIELGVRNFRIELLNDDPPSEIARVIDLYQGLLAGRVTGEEVWTQLSALNRVGVTRGTLEHDRDPLAII